LWAFGSYQGTQEARLEAIMDSLLTAGAGSKNKYKHREGKAIHIEIV
jgi:hypothetical protein